MLAALAKAMVALSGQVLAQGTLSAPAPETPSARGTAKATPSACPTVRVRRSSRAAAKVRR